MYLGKRTLQPDESPSTGAKVTTKDRLPLGGQLPAVAANNILSLLDPADPSRAEQEYLRFFRKLVWFFDRRHCESAEDLAAETIWRIVKAVADRKYIEPESRFAYFWAVANNVCMEERKRRKSEPLADHAVYSSVPPDLDQFIYFEECVTAALSAEERELLCSSYERGYEPTAKRFGITLGTARLKVYRIREKLRRFAAMAQASSDCIGCQCNE